MSKLSLPDDLKYLAGLRYDRASRVDYNSVTLEDVLPGLFYVVRVGRRRGKGEWNGRDAAAAVELLLEPGGRLVGFDGDGQRVLEEWLKASVLRLDDRGASQKVMSVQPLHFLTYRIDLPSNWTHLRGVPEFIAALLHQEPVGVLSDRRDELFALQSRDNPFWSSFGSGWRNPEDLWWARPGQDGYDETTLLDLESLLAVRLCERLSPPKETTGGKHGGTSGYVQGLEPFCPAQARRLREDFSLFLRAYPPEVVPVRTLGEYLLCLLSLNLTTYFLSHVAASNHLYEHAEWLDDGHRNGAGRRWELSLYPDLTDGHNRASRRLAQQSYARQHAALMGQVRTMVGLRLLDRYLGRATDLPGLGGLREAGDLEFLRLLAQARQPSCAEVGREANTCARQALRGLEDHWDANGWPESLKATFEDDRLAPFDRLVELLATGQDELPAHMVRYLNGITRKNQVAGLICDSAKRGGPSHFTIGLQMLETLVQLMVLRPGNPPKARPLDIYHFVDELKERYSIWIDEPPPGLDQSVEARQAAQANFEALKEKLRQLGFFRAVSDARRMQRLRPRYQPVLAKGLEVGDDPVA